MPNPIAGLRRLPHPRFVAFLIVFAAVGLAGVTLAGLRPSLALVAGFDAGALVFLASTARLWHDEHIPAIRARAARDDGGRTLLLALLFASLVAALVALGLAVQHHNGRTAADLALVVGTLALAWFLVNVVYAFHYAHLYYDQTRQGDRAGGDRGGLDFPGEHPPVFADFCYFSFIIGMTCQVSDVQISHPVLRRAALLHGLVAFFFNLGVLALTINVLAGVL